MQSWTVKGATPYGLPLKFKILPQFLNYLGYKSVAVGKWHLGSFSAKYAPVNRGFATHVGHWTGQQDYFNHTAKEGENWGYDFRRNMNVSWSDYGKYATDIFTEEALKAINLQNTTNSMQPLFLYLAHLAVHSPLQAPEEIIEMFRDRILDPNRRIFAAMLYKMDESVSKIVAALKENNMLENSVIVFTTDNGGPASGFNKNVASNFPLKGIKDTLWEGGVRGSAFVWSPLLNKTSYISKQMMSIEDWLPTLYSVAGGTVSDLPQKLDGFNMWTVLSEDSLSTRHEVLHNIDESRSIVALRKDEWKMVKGTTYNGQWDDWYGPSGLDFNHTYNYQNVLNSSTSLHIESIGHPVPNTAKMANLRQSANVQCHRNGNESSCKPLNEVCLFNINDDPCEYNNVASKYPDLVKIMQIRLEKYKATAVPPENKPADPRANPKYFNNTWTNWWDMVDHKNGSTSTWIWVSLAVIFSLVLFGYIIVKSFQCYKRKNPMESTIKIGYEVDKVEVSMEEVI